MPEQAQTEAQLSVRTESESVAPRWTHGLNPFVEAREAELSTGPQTINAVLTRFDDWVNRGTVGADRLEALLQGTKVVLIPEGTGQSWEDILSPYLPDRIQNVEIYDRYIRNRCQFNSLDLFLDALQSHASSDGIVVVPV